MDDIRHKQSSVLTLVPPFENQPARSLPELRDEIHQVEAVMEQVAGQLEQPGVDLATAMKLSIHQSVLKAYLRGLQYAAGAPRDAEILGESDTEASVARCS